MTDPISPDTKPVRSSEQLDWGALEAFVRKRLAIDDPAPMEVSQFPGGHSNLTYVLRFGARELVLRRPPFGPVPPKAHDMAREYRVLAAVHPVFPLAPRPLVLCEDPQVVGSTFYVMERRHGIVVRHDEPPRLEDDPAARRRASASVVDALAELHRIDVSAGDVATIGKPAGFVGRQVRGWSERWNGSRIDELPEMDALSGWLAERLPPDPERFSVVHGDYKLDNVMLDAEGASRVVAVFDWEMSALGDPLVDVGITLCYWVHAAPMSERDATSSVTCREGWYTRDEILDHYVAKTGADLTRIRFYEVFAIFKLAVVAQQIFYRYRRGQTDDPRFARLDRRVADLARLAASLAENE